MSDEIVFEHATRTEHADVWSFPAGKQELLVVVSDDAFHSVWLKPEDSAEKKARIIKGGERSEEVLGKAETHIALDKIKHVRSEEDSEEVIISRRTVLKDGEYTLDLPSKEFRDEFMDCFQRRLGAGAVSERAQQSKFKAALGPLIAELFIAGVTALLILASLGIIEAPTSGRRSGLVKLVFALAEAITPYGVVAIGLIAIGINTWILISKVKNPPIMLTVTPASRDDTQ